MTSVFFCISKPIQSTNLKIQRLQSAEISASFSKNCLKKIERIKIHVKMLEDPGATICCNLQVSAAMLEEARKKTCVTCLKIQREEESIHEKGKFSNLKTVNGLLETRDIRSHHCCILGFLHLERSTSSTSSGRLLQLCLWLERSSRGGGDEALDVLLLSCWEKESPPESSLATKPIALSYTTLVHRAQA
jgi:hypothetical protein